MTLIEALKTGKRFKRTYWVDYILDWDLRCKLSVQDILAEDWEIEPGPVVWETEVTVRYSLGGTHYMGAVLKDTHKKLEPLINKKVRVIVEPLE